MLTMYHRKNKKMGCQASYILDNAVKRKNSKTIDTNTQTVTKKKNSKYTSYTQEDYKKGLQTLSLPMKILLNTLEYNPKVLFVELNLIGKNYSSYGCVYKTRNKSVIQFLTPSEVEQKAIRDVELMCNTIKKMILASGKLMTSGTQPFQTYNTAATCLINCKICKAIFSKRSDLFNHIASNHPDFPFKSCTSCDKKFPMLHGVAQYVSGSHTITRNENKSKDSPKRSEVTPFNSPSDKKDRKKNNYTYSHNLKDSSKGLSEVSEKEKVTVNSTHNHTLNDSNKSSYFLTKSDNTKDSFEKDKSLKITNDRMNKEPSEPDITVKHNTVKDDALPELNSTQHEVNYDNVMESENQSRVSFTEFQEQKTILSSSQNGKETDTKAVPVDEKMFYDKICCICLDIINVTKQIIDKQKDLKFKCHECPFCGMCYADMYFEHHVATVHLVCNEEECSSRLILTGLKLRKLLTMQTEMECIHANCNHTSLIDSAKSEGNLHDAIIKDDQTLKSTNNLKKMTVFVINKDKTKLNECHTTEDNIEKYQPRFYSKDLNTCLKVSDYFEMQKEKSKQLLNECSVSDMKFSTKTEPCSGVEEEHYFEENEHVHHTVDVRSFNMEENKLSSSNVYVYEKLSQESCFDKSLEIVEVKSSEPHLCCCVCKEIFHQDQKLLAHLFNYHRFSHPFTCDICFLCYKNIKDLQGHMLVHGKQIALEKTSSNTSDSMKQVSLKKYNLSEKNLIFEYYVQEEPYLSESSQAQYIESAESNVTKDISTNKPSVTDEIFFVKLKVPEDPPFLPKELPIKENSSLESHISKVSTIKCNPRDIKFKSDDPTALFEDEQKDSPLKKKKLKISCVVEKVEYPLDIHNLYAHIRKAKDPNVDNSMELELRSNSSTECINANLLSVKKKKENSVDSNVSPSEKTTVKRKISPSFSLPMKKMKKDRCEVRTDSLTDEVIFECRTCEKTFDYKRSYSEHMFFMHDVIFDDSVVCDLLKPSSQGSENIKNFFKNTEYRINSSNNIEFPQFSETRLTLDNADKVKPCPILSRSSEKLDKHLADEAINNVKNCSQCGERYMQVTSYFQHRYDIHGDDSLVHVCENCNKVLITINMVNSHLCTQVNTFSCKDCGIKFLNGLALKEHNTMKHLESTGPHVCHDCKKCFLTNRMLQKHKRIIHSSTRGNISVKQETESRSDESDGSKANISDEADKFKSTFVNKNLLRKHRTVSPVKPLITKKGKINSLTCPVCKFVLQTTRRLQAHLMVNHSKVTDICLLCNRLFAFGRGIRHMLDFHIIPTCNKNKEYELSWEGDPRKDVREAIEVLGEKRLLAICNYDDYITLINSASFQCRFCLMTYSAVRYYRNHYVQRHDEFCALCSQSFKSNKDFTLHVEEVHNSLKHYLWFTETIISTVIQTERSRENSSETFMQIIGRKLDENEVNAASQLLERMEDERLSVNSIYLEKSQVVNTPCELPGPSSELSVSTVEPALPECELPHEACEVFVVTSEPPRELNRAEILELPDFCMEYEITNNGTVVTQNPNYCNNEILVNNINDEKECMKSEEERKKASNSTMSVKSYDMSNSICEKSVSVNDSSTINLKENEIMNVIADNQVSFGHVAKDISSVEGGECYFVAVGINNDVNNEKIALVVTEEDLRIYKNNIQALAERLSTTCNELSVDEIVETLQAYVISRG